jgi:hypothetical protein
MVWSAVRSVKFRRTTEVYTPEDRILHDRHCENFKFPKYSVLFRFSAQNKCRMMTLFVFLLFIYKANSESRIIV